MEDDTMHRRRIEPCALLGLCLIAVTSGFAHPGIVRSEEPKMTPRTISVRGTGTISAKPDVAHIEAGVMSEAPTAQKALAANNEAMTRLFQILKERGIAEKDIQTSQLQVSPQYSQPQPPRPLPGGPNAPVAEAGEFIPRVIGYRVDNIVSITSRRVATLGDVLDALVEAGANQIHGIRFEVDEPKKLLVEARKRAMIDAREKADVLAGEAGVVVGHPLKIEEQEGGSPVIFSPGRAKLMAASAMPVAAGENEMSISVSVVYELKDPK
jgi:uncharacterized protein YggE